MTTFVKNIQTCRKKNENAYGSTFSFMTSLSAFVNAAFEQFPASITASTDLYCARHYNGLFSTWASTLQLRFIYKIREIKQASVHHSFLNTTYRQR